MVTTIIIVYDNQHQGELEGGRNCPPSRRIGWREKPSTLTLSIVVHSTVDSKSSLNVSSSEAVFRNSDIFSLQSLLALRMQLGLWDSLSSSDPLSPTTSPPFFFPHDGSGADGRHSRHTGIFSHCHQPFAARYYGGQLAIRPGWRGWTMG